MGTAMKAKKNTFVNASPRRVKKFWQDVHEIEKRTFGLVNAKPDLVNHPPHYKQGKIEVSDFIIDQKMSFLEGNIVKYVARYKFKNGTQDLKKALWYLQKLIETLEQSK